MEWILGFIIILGIFAISGAWKELVAHRKTQNSEKNVFYG